MGFSYTEEAKKRENVGGRGRHAKERAWVKVKQWEGW